MTISNMVHVQCNPNFLEHRSVTDCLRFEHLHGSLHFCSMGLQTINAQGYSVQAKISINVEFDILVYHIYS